MSPILNDIKAPLDVVAFAALSLGMVYVGSCSDEVAQSIMFALMDRNSAELGEALVRFLPLGLGLLYLGKQVVIDSFLVLSTRTLSPSLISVNLFQYIEQESVEATAEISKTLCEKIRKCCEMTLLSCAYAGTGNVLKVSPQMYWWFKLYIFHCLSSVVADNSLFRCKNFWISVESIWRKIISTRVQLCLE